MPTHSILAWRIPWTKEPGGLWSIGSQRVRHDWSNLAQTYTFNIRGWKHDGLNYSFATLTLYVWGNYLISLNLLLFIVKMGLKMVESIGQPCPILRDPMDCSTPGLPVHHQLLEFTQTHVLWVGDTIQPSHPLSSPSPPTFNLSQHLVKAMVFPVVMHGCESWTIKKNDTEELMLLNCSVGEDSWESLGLQGDPTSPS